MTDTIARFRGLETVTAEQVRELGEVLLDLGQSREVGSMGKAGGGNGEAWRTTDSRHCTCTTLCPLMSTRRSKCSKKSAQRIGTETGAS